MDSRERTCKKATSLFLELLGILFFIVGVVLAICHGMEMKIVPVWFPLGEGWTIVLFIFILPAIFLLWGREEWKEAEGG